MNDDKAVTHWLITIAIICITTIIIVFLEENTKVKLAVYSRMAVQSCECKK